MSDWYKLEGKIPVKIDDYVAYLKEVKWDTPSEKGWRVGDDTIDWVRVSTVFLSLDHQWNDWGKPLVFETMIFWGWYDQYQERHSTWEEAEEWHRKAIALVNECVIWTLIKRIPQYLRDAQWKISSKIKKTIAIWK